MTNISIYDIEAQRIESVAERNDMTVAELVEMLCEYMDDLISDNNLEEGD